MEEVVVVVGAARAAAVSIRLWILFVVLVCVHGGRVMGAGWWYEFGGYILLS